MRRLAEIASISLLAASMVLGVLYLAAWDDFRKYERVSPRQRETRRSLLIVDGLIRFVVEETGKAPHDLSSLAAKTTPDSFPVEGGRFIDAWQNELQYALQDDGTFKLYSLGRDGIAGGVGLNADLYSDHREREVEWPTLSQFFLTFDRNEVNTGGLTSAAFFAAALVFGSVFISLRRSRPIDPKKSIVSMEAMARLVGIVLLAIVVGAAIMPIHIPSGH